MRALIEGPCGRMGHVCLAGALLLLPRPAAAELPSSERPDSTELPDVELVRFIESRIDSGELVGLIVGYIEGPDRFVQAFGTTWRGSDLPPDERTVFEISSIAKTFLGTLLAASVIEGDLALEDPVNRHLGTGIRLAGFEGREITLLDLASHQSGLPYMPTDIAPGDGANPYAWTREEDLVGSINAFVPERPAGQGRSYSAFAYAVLAHVLSTRYGTSFEALVRERITGPLGMSDTVMRLDDSQGRRLAVGYTPEGEVAVPLDQGVFRAAGSMYSTLHDLLLWLEANMSEPDDPLGDALEMTHRMSNELGTIGLAWHRTEGHDDRSQYGTAHGYRAYVGFLADGSRGVVVLANTRANVMEVGERLLIGSELSPTDPP